MKFFADTACFRFVINPLGHRGKLQPLTDVVDKRCRLLRVFASFGISGKQVG